MEQVETLKRLKELRDEKRAVFCPSFPAFSKRIPAAFVINMSGTIIERMMSAGLFVYTPSATCAENENGEDNHD